MLFTIIVTDINKAYLLSVTITSKKQQHQHSKHNHVSKISDRCCNRNQKIVWIFFLFENINSREYSHDKQHTYKNNNIKESDKQYFKRKHWSDKKRCSREFGEQ